MFLSHVDDSLLLSPSLPLSLESVGMSSSEDETTTAKALANACHRR